jgi:flagellar hook-length control protein FliK
MRKTGSRLMASTPQPAAENPFESVLRNFIDDSKGASAANADQGDFDNPDFEPTDRDVAATVNGAGDSATALVAAMQIFGAPMARPEIPANVDDAAPSNPAEAVTLSAANSPSELAAAPRQVDEASTAISPSPDASTSAARDAGASPLSTGGRDIAPRSETSQTTMHRPVSGSLFKLQSAVAADTPTAADVSARPSDKPDGAEPQRLARRESGAPSSMASIKDPLIPNTAGQRVSTEATARRSAVAVDPASGMDGRNTASGVPVTSVLAGQAAVKTLAGELPPLRTTYIQEAADTRPELVANMRTPPSADPTPSLLVGPGAPNLDAMPVTASAVVTSAGAGGEALERPTSAARRVSGAGSSASNRQDFEAENFSLRQDPAQPKSPLTPFGQLAGVAGALHWQSDKELPAMRSADATDSNTTAVGPQAFAAPTLPQAAAPVAINHPIASPQWAAAFSSAVLRVASEQISEATLTMTPGELGTISIKIGLDGNNVSVGFTAENSDVRHAVSASLPVLQDLLAQAGLSLGHSSVSQENAREPALFSRPPASGANTDAAQPLPAPLPAPQRRPSSRGGIDLFA